MRLVVDALAARFGGTAAMAGQVSTALARRDDVEKVVLLSEVGSVVQRHVEQTPKLDTLAIRVPDRLRLPSRLMWEALRLPALLQRFDATAVLTCSGMLPRHPARPVVCMLGNALPFERTDAPNRIRRIAIKRTSQRSDVVIVPTEYMARFVSYHPNMAVVPHGVDKRIFRPAGTLGDEILYVSDFYAHKRHDLAIRAWKRLSEPRPLLRFIGNGSVEAGVHARVTKLAAASGPGIVVGGEHVPLMSLVNAYRRARIVLMPSEHESFSMPLSEAVCMGLPVVARDHPVLRETAGSAGVYVAGDDEVEWAAAIEWLLSDRSAHSQLRRAALEGCARFSWDATAAAVVEQVRGLGAAARSGRRAAFRREALGYDGPA